MTTHPVVRIIFESDAMTKMTLLVLLGMSIICWAVALYVGYLVRVHEAQCTTTRKMLDEVTSFEGLMTSAAALRDTMPGYLLMRVLAFVKKIAVTHKTLSDRDDEMLDTVVDQALSDTMRREEKQLPILSTCAAVSPLIGLFGTVWGLIHSFVRMSIHQSADLATVAPGIAEALITTLAGLVVAIPAMMLFHYLHHRVRALEYQLVAIADRVLWIIRNTKEVKISEREDHASHSSSRFSTALDA